MSEKLQVIDKITLSKNIARRMGLTITDAITIIDIFQDEIIDAIKQNKKVQLNGFLIFTPKNIEKSKIVSALDNKEYEMPAKRTVSIRVGKNFKETIKGSYKGKDDTDDCDKESKRSKKSSKKAK